MDDHARGFPVAIDHIDDLEAQRVAIERDALAFLGEQHGFAVLQPQLLVFRALGGGEIVEHVLVVDDAVLENLDEGGTLVGMRGP